MITEKTIPVYKCGFCSKYYIRKHHAVKHDKYCPRNPANKHKCFEYCVHLRKVECEGVNQFQCTKLNKLMYSYIAERRNYQPAFNDTERMPAECDAYEANDGTNNQNYPDDLFNYPL